MPAPHPILQSARREALVVAVLWATAGTWSVSFCWWNGYDPTQPLDFTLGFPSWIFWGVAFPWVLCALLSLVIANLVMTDADLGTEPGTPGNERADEDPFDA